MAEVNGFFHNDFDLSHFSTDEIFVKSNPRFKVGTHYCLSIFLFSHYKFNISMLSDVFHRFFKNCIIHQFKEIFYEIVGSFGPKLDVEINVGFHPC